MRRALITLLFVGLASPALAGDHLMVEGVLKDDANKPLDGQFSLTFALYDAEDAETAIWSEAHETLDVSGGFFQARLGATEALTAHLFSTSQNLWLGITLADNPELPRTPLETDPYAFFAQVAGTAQGLECSGCVDASDVGFPFAASDQPGGVANSAVVAETANTLSCTGCVELEMLTAGVLHAANIEYDDTETALGAHTVQGAIEALKALIGEGGGGNGKVQEGNGSIVPYVNQWGLPAFGVATEYIHLLNPISPKVVTYLYGGENTGFASSNNLVVQSSYQPNQATGNVNGTAGETSLSVQNSSFFSAGAHILIHQSVGKNGNGTDAGSWELNVVTGVTGNSIQVAKPLKHNYVSDGNTNGPEAQAVIAASFNQLDVISGGQISPAQHLTASSTTDFKGGIVYVRAQTITVKSGGLIQADGYGFDTSSYSGGQGYPGDSECQVNPSLTTANNCSGGGGGQANTTSCNSAWRGGGGGGNKEAGKKPVNHSWAGTGGNAKGDELATTLHHGGGGGGSRSANGGRGGGIIVLGAKTVIVEEGGSIRANGNVGGSQSCSAGGGGGAGGSIIIFAENFDNKGTVEVNGGKGGTGTSAPNPEWLGGDGGAGWLLKLAPVPGVVNQTFATGVEIWVDGNNVTPSIGDPNGKGEPHWNATDKKWGASGTDKWNTGQLDLTNVANWTLGEHKIEFRETGGAGGDLKGYTYVIYPFTESKPPENDSCVGAQKVPISPTPVVVSGTTEDTMGKTKATDKNSHPECGGVTGPDVVYEIDVTERALLNAALVAPFSSRLYLKKENCASGDLVWCADSEFVTDPIDAGKYFLFVDSDLPAAKGDFNLGLSITSAPLPVNDTCDTAIELIFSAGGVATHSGTSLYATDDLKGFCPAAKTGGPDVLYKFTAGTGQTIQVDVAGDFEPIIQLMKGSCDGLQAVSCQASSTLTLPGQQGGEYWLVIDGIGPKEWGPFELTVSLQ